MLSLMLSILLMAGATRVDSGAVAGTLRLPDGRPASGVRVGVMAPPGVGRGAPNGAGTLVIQGQADASGKFQLEEVPPGRYYILAGRLEAPTFYPGVPDFATAKAIDVVANVTLRDINFEVTMPGRSPLPKSPPPAPLGLIPVKGRIVLKGDPSPPPAGITFQIANPPKALRSVPVIVDADGTFTIALEAGDQSLSVESLQDGYSLLSLTSGTTDLRTQPLRVRTGVAIDVTLNAVVTPRYRLLGRLVEDSTERPLVGEQVELVRPTGEVSQTTVNAQGIVTFIRLLPGAYVLRLVSSRLEMPEKPIVVTNSSVSVELRAREKR